MVALALAAEAAALDAEAAALDAEAAAVVFTSPDTVLISPIRKLRSGPKDLMYAKILATLALNDTLSCALLGVSPVYVVRSVIVVNLIPQLLISSWTILYFCG
jgi:hypothetical protein